MHPGESTLQVCTSFDSIQELKDACKLYSIENMFEYRVLKANKTRYTILCKIVSYTAELEYETAP